MALNPDNKPIFATIPEQDSGQATDGTSAGAWNSDSDGIVIYTAPAANGAVVTSIIATTDEAANRDIFVYILDSAEVINLGTVQVPLGSGSSESVAPFDVLAAISGTRTDNNGNAVLDLGKSAVLKFALVATLTASDIMEVAAKALIPDA